LSATTCSFTQDRTAAETVASLILDFIRTPPVAAPATTETDAPQGGAEPAGLTRLTGLQLRPLAAILAANPQ
jgi:hypothetical protein